MTTLDPRLNFPIQLYGKVSSQGLSLRVVISQHPPITIQKVNTNFARALVIAQFV